LDGCFIASPLLLSNGYALSIAPGHATNATLPPSSIAGGIWTHIRLNMSAIAGAPGYSATLWCAIGRKGSIDHCRVDQTPVATSSISSQADGGIAPLVKARFGRSRPAAGPPTHRRTLQHQQRQLAVRGLPSLAIALDASSSVPISTVVSFSDFSLGLEF